ncbi:OmpH family outer membrane protein [Ulvibacter antarcticus]|uniref:Periplasmic chaperone for outer membrane proteins Skp n=1 Tax=Ulvibacter antarcticus TaxID=442714 RepID=A0A3L9YC43_9FLAO|nr:OmpH family outer membrane protein [Ulvibacter antarcticus]RMA56679.1 periplasmic chaperone for outer membrane proteins Skp [Ulvibacter antarcticus]
MKNFKSLLVAIVLLVGATSFVNAQSKIAHIDTQTLMEAMPEMKAGQNQLEKLKKTYDTEIKGMAKEFEAKVQQYGSEEGTKTQEENEKRVLEVQGMERNISAYRQQALQDLQKKELDVYQPILDKARAAIQKVARAQGIQYVMDSTTGSGLLLADGKDLLPDVKKELGI